MFNGFQYSPKIDANDTFTFIKRALVANGLYGLEASVTDYFDHDANDSREAFIGRVTVDVLCDDGPSEEHRTDPPEVQSANQVTVDMISGRGPDRLFYLARIQEGIGGGVVPIRYASIRGSEGILLLERESSLVAASDSREFPAWRLCRPLPTVSPSIATSPPELYHEKRGTWIEEYRLKEGVGFRNYPTQGMTREDEDAALSRGEGHRWDDGDGMLTKSAARSAEG